MRSRIGEELELIDADQFAFCWIVDFPMFETDETTGKLDFSHNPFSMPQGGMEALESEDPLDILGYQYDIVCNGIELSSGAIGITSRKLCSKPSPLRAMTPKLWNRNLAAC